MNICKQLKNWCKKYLNEDIDIILDNEYSFDINDIIIIPENKDPEDQVRDFRRYFKKCCLDIDILLTNDTISFLHELGHQQTILEIPDTLYWISEFMNAFIMKHLNRFTRWLYYRLPVEKTATIWARDFWIKNYEAVDELDMIFMRWRNESCQSKR